MLYGEGWLNFLSMLNSFGHGRAHYYIVCRVDDQQGLHPAEKWI